LDRRVTATAGPEKPYLERRRRRRRRLWLAGIGVAALVVALTARRPDVADPCETPSAASEAELALMPAGLSLDGIGTVTGVRTDDLYIMVQAVATKPLPELTVLIQDAVVAAGYRPAGMDSEEFEAEVFFTAGPYAAGQARVERSACRGRWDIELVLLDRAAAPSQATLPGTTTVP
jgi:hypothetical protein